MSLQSFPRFLELPKELQIQIWTFAMKTAKAGVRIGDRISFLESRSTYYHRPIMEAPYSGRRVYVYNLCTFSMRPVFAVNNPCQLFRMLFLEYGHKEVKGIEILESTWLCTPAKRADLKVRRKEALDILKECMEQICHSMRVDEYKARW